MTKKNFNGVNSETRPSSKVDGKSTDELMSHNVINDYEICNLREATTLHNQPISYFDLNLGGVYLRGCKATFNHEGVAYVTGSSHKAGNGNYYADYYINDESLKNNILIELGYIEKP